MFRVTSISRYDFRQLAFHARQPSKSLKLNNNIIFYTFFVINPFLILFYFLLPYFSQNNILLPATYVRSSFASLAANCKYN